MMESITGGAGINNSNEMFLAFGLTYKIINKGQKVNQMDGCQ